MTEYRAKYKRLKAKLKYLVYEQECFVEEMRKTQRKLVRVSRDKSFLLDRLMKYETVPPSSSDDEATASSSSSDDGHSEMKIAHPKARKRPNEDATGLPPSKIAAVGEATFAENTTVREAGFEETPRATPFKGVSAADSAMNSAAAVASMPVQSCNNIASAPPPLEALPVFGGGGGGEMHAVASPPVVMSSGAGAGASAGAGAGGNYVPSRNDQATQSSGSASDSSYSGASSGSSEPLSPSRHPHPQQQQQASVEEDDNSPSILPSSTKYETAARTQALPRPKMALANRPATVPAAGSSTGHVRLQGAHSHATPTTATTATAAAGLVGQSRTPSGKAHHATHAPAQHGHPTLATAVSHPQSHSTPSSSASASSSALPTHGTHGAGASQCKYMLDETTQCTESVNMKSKSPFCTHHRSIIRKKGQAQSYNAARRLPRVDGSSGVHHARPQSTSHLVAHQSVSPGIPPPPHNTG